MKAIWNFGFPTLGSNPGPPAQQANDLTTRPPSYIMPGPTYLHCTCFHLNCPKMTKITINTTWHTQSSIVICSHALSLTIQPLSDTFTYLGTSHFDVQNYVQHCHMFISILSHICLTIDPKSGFPYYFSSENPIGGIACRILVVRAPIEGSAYYFRFFPIVIRRKK